MARGMDWAGAERRQMVRERGGVRVEPVRRKKTKPTGITNAQAAELAKLQRAAGLPYTGNGMTASRAQRIIDAVKRELSA